MRLAIIPARGGSKRIPRKNIKDFQGMPIIGYAILAARDAGFDDVMVSTDDAEIADIARQNGILCVSPLEQFRTAHTAGRSSYLPGDLHISANGHPLVEFDREARQVRGHDLLLVEAVRSPPQLRGRETGRGGLWGKDGEPRLLQERHHLLRLPPGVRVQDLHRDVRRGDRREQRFPPQDSEILPVADLLEELRRLRLDQLDIADPADRHGRLHQCGR